MKMTPARETVAGEALRRSSTSICSVTLGRSIGMRSLFASVRILLSSMTVLRFWFGLGLGFGSGLRSGFGLTLTLTLT